MKRLAATVLGVGAGIIGAVSISRARRGKHMPDEPEGIAIPVVTVQEEKVSEAVSEAVDAVSSFTPDGTNIYANHGDEKRLAGSVADAGFSLDETPDIVVNGSSAKRAIIAVAIDDDLHEYSEPLVEKLEGLKKRSYARVLLVGDGSTEVAELIADDADGTVQVATPSTLSETFET